MIMKPSKKIVHSSVAIIVLAIAAGIAVAYFLLYPQYKDIAEIDQSIRDAEQAIIDSKTDSSNSEEEKFAVEDIDVMVSRVESFVVDEYRKGGVTAQAKERLDTALDLLHKKARRRDNV